MSHTEVTHESQSGHKDPNMSQNCHRTDCGNKPGMDLEWTGILRNTWEHMGTGGVNKESIGKIGTH